MSKLLTIRETANLLGVSPQTLRRWEKEGKGIACQRTSGGQRRYDASLLRSQKRKKVLQDRPTTLGYARVSCHDSQRRYWQIGSYT
jgi:putative resolvase